MHIIFTIARHSGYFNTKVIKLFMNNNNNKKTYVYSENPQVHFMVNHTSACEQYYVESLITTINQNKHT